MKLEDLHSFQIKTTQCQCNLSNESGFQETLNPSIYEPRWFQLTFEDGGIKKIKFWNRNMLEKMTCHDDCLDKTKICIFVFKLLTHMFDWSVGWISNENIENLWEFYSKVVGTRYIDREDWGYLNLYLVELIVLVFNFCYGDTVLRK